jgi:hypothetical protein
VFGSEASGSEAQDQRTEKDGFEIKLLAEIAYWDVIPWLLLASVTTNVIGKRCFQKIVALVFQMEESKQNTWMA